MDCKQIHERLIFLISDDVTPSEKKEISGHLDECAACRAAYEKLKPVWDILDAEKSNRRDFRFVNRVMQRIDAQASKQKKGTPSVALRILRPSVVTVLSAAAIFTGIILGAKFSLQFTNPADQRFQEIEAFTNEYFLDELREENMEYILFTQNTE